MSKLQAIKTIVTNKTARGVLLCKKYSPEILIGVGIVGIISSTAMACKATTKAEDILDETKEKLEKINQVKETVAIEEYTEKDYKKDLTITYVQTGVSFVKLYGPSVTLGVASIACILGAHGIMHKRNLGLIAAYKAVETSFGDYRKRVVEQYGEETDRCLKNGIKKEKVTTAAYTDETGVKHPKTVSEIDVIDPNGLSQYAKYFDEGCLEWTKSPDYNYTFVKCQQNIANDLLHARGHIFLNEVYDLLGIPRTKAGAVVGWVKGQGDDFVDFGVFNTKSEASRDFVNGYEPVILLDFNVDGVIYDLI